MQVHRIRELDVDLRISLAICLFYKTEKYSHMQTHTHRDTHTVSDLFLSSTSPTHAMSPRLLVSMWYFLPTSHQPHGNGFRNCSHSILNECHAFWSVFIVTRPCFRKSVGFLCMCGVQMCLEHVLTGVLLWCSLASLNTFYSGTVAWAKVKT